MAKVVAYIRVKFHLCEYWKCFRISSTFCCSSDYRVCFNSNLCDKLPTPIFSSVFAILRRLFYAIKYTKIVESKQMFINLFGHCEFQSLSWFNFVRCVFRKCWNFFKKNAINSLRYRYKLILFFTCIQWFSLDFPGLCYTKREAGPPFGTIILEGHALNMFEWII